MRLTNFTEFGLRVLMYVAVEPDRNYTMAEISDTLGLSRHHLTKIVRDLAAGAIVATRRGVGGGFRLARPPEAISLGEVVRRLERSQPLAECFRADGGTCCFMPGCRLRHRLADAQEAFMRELDRTPLSECAYAPGSLTAAAEAV